LAREPSALSAVRGELQQSCGRDARYDQAVEQVLGGVTTGNLHEVSARRITEALAMALQAALLLRSASPLAEAFIQSRLGGERGQAFGTLPASAPFADIIARALP
jgi:putative acyl-CoA dehydrogenase